LKILLLASILSIIKFLYSKVNLAVTKEKKLETLYKKIEKLYSNREKKTNKKTTVLTLRTNACAAMKGSYAPHNCGRIVR